MKRWLTVFVASLALAACGWAQSLDDYLKLRREHGVTQASGLGALASFVGERVLEISGTVTGTLRKDGKHLLILDDENGGVMFVGSENLPSWITGGRVTARLLVLAKRESEFSSLNAQLISAISEGKIAAHEAAARKAAVPRVSGSTADRSGPVQRASNQVLQGNLSAQQALPYYATFIKNANKRLSDAQAISIAESILGYSLEYGVDARLIMAMVMTESGFRPDATSHKGAMGLGQLMPGTARGLGVSNAYDTDQNLYGTIKLVRKNLDKYTAEAGDDYEGLVLALAAYNAGGGNVRKHGGVPPFRETQNYIKKVISLYKELSGIAD
ncbi:MAG: lytic transglycosylase domain-containing protein [Fimbriimonadaceae bacterium]